MAWPNDAPISRRSPSSAMAAMTWRTSYPTRASSGTIVGMVSQARLGGSCSGCCGGASALLAGRWASTSATTASACSRSDATRWATPEPLACSCWPPSCSCVDDPAGGGLDGGGARDERHGAVAHHDDVEQPEHERQSGDDRAVHDHDGRDDTRRRRQRSRHRAPGVEPDRAGGRDRRSHRRPGRGGGRPSIEPRRSLDRRPPPRPRRWSRRRRDRRGAPRPVARGRARRPSRPHGRWLRSRWVGPRPGRSGSRRRAAVPRRPPGVQRQPARRTQARGWPSRTRSPWSARCPMKRPATWLTTSTR